MIETVYRVERATDRQVPADDALGSSAGPGRKLFGQDFAQCPLTAPARSHDPLSRKLRSRRILSGLLSAHLSPCYHYYANFYFFKIFYLSKKVNFVTKFVQNLVLMSTFCFY